ncbi:MAG: exodeoxyribonuclease VII small subunit [Alphaproteobacteria bacterium]|nr:exodeoxyribonuclease VII small subunit [Alphaproteobacteria bacterium]
MSAPQSVEKLSFEDALQELETIVRKLETGEALLEDSITAYERGVKLKKHCETKLRDAQEKIEKISIDQNGKISTQPLDTES